jgi:acyl carrier protein
MEKRDKLRQFLAAILARKGDNEPFADEDSLLLAGRIDSLNVLEIVAFLEKEFAYDIENEVFDPGQFDSLESILQLLEAPHS